MNKVSPLAVSYSNNLTFNFSGTLRNEKANLDDYSSSTYIIDVDGTVYQSAPATEQHAIVTIIGGVDRFLYSKSATQYTNFFLTEPQKVVLYKIMRDLSNYTSSAVISSDNDKLEQALTSLYTNYCG